MTNTDTVERLRELLEKHEEAMRSTPNWRPAGAFGEILNALPALLDAVEALEPFARLKPVFAEDDDEIGVVLALGDDELGSGINRPLAMLDQARAALATLKGEG